MPYVVIETDGIDSGKTTIHGPPADLKAICADVFNNETHQQAVNVLSKLERIGYKVVSHVINKPTNPGTHKFYHAWTLNRSMTPEEEMEQLQVAQA